jgi:hypothetical protein
MNSQSSNNSSANMRAAPPVVMAGTGGEKVWTCSGCCMEHKISKPFCPLCR